MVLNTYETQFLQACLYGDSNVVREMIQDDITNRVDQSHHLATTSHAENESLSLVKIRNQDGCTGLHLASASGHIEVLKTLIHHGADINAYDTTGHGALQRASAEGRLDVVKFLVANGARINHQDEVHGNTPLHEAAWKGFSRTLQYLLHPTDGKSSSNYYIGNRGGFSPLHLACQNGHNECCRILLRAGCKSSLKNNYGDTPLHTAARYGHAGVTRILISSKCNSTLQNKNGDTPLHIAAAMGRRKIVKIILCFDDRKIQARRTLTHIRNEQGERCADIARRKNFQQILNSLKEFERVHQISSHIGEESRVMPHFVSKKDGLINPSSSTDEDHVDQCNKNITSLASDALKLKYRGANFERHRKGRTDFKQKKHQGTEANCGSRTNGIPNDGESSIHPQNNVNNFGRNLEWRIQNLEERTREQLFALLNTMKETFANERTEIDEKVKKEVDSKFQRYGGDDCFRSSNGKSNNDSKPMGEYNLNDVLDWLEKRVSYLENHAMIHPSKSSRKRRNSFTEHETVIRNKLLSTESMTATAVLSSPYAAQSQLRRVASDDNISVVNIAKKNQHINSQQRKISPNVLQVSDRPSRNFLPPVIHPKCQIRSSQNKRVNNIVPSSCYNLPTTPPSTETGTRGPPPLETRFPATTPESFDENWANFEDTTSLIYVNQSEVWRDRQFTQQADSQRSSGKERTLYSSINDSRTRLDFPTLVPSPEPPESEFERNYHLKTRQMMPSLINQMSAITSTFGMRNSFNNVSTSHPKCTTSTGNCVPQNSEVRYPNISPREPLPSIDVLDERGGRIVHAVSALSSDGSNADSHNDSGYCATATVAGFPSRGHFGDRKNFKNNPHDAIRDPRDRLPNPTIESPRRSHVSRQQVSTRDEDHKLNCNDRFMSGSINSQVLSDGRLMSSNSTLLTVQNMPDISDSTLIDDQIQESGGTSARLPESDILGVSRHPVIGSVKWIGDLTDSSNHIVMNSHMRPISNPILKSFASSSHDEESLKFVNAASQAPNVDSIDGDDSSAMPRGSLV